MKAGIAIDDWKLPIFQRHLSQSGYSFETGPGVTPDTLLMAVHTENAEALIEVVSAANLEAKMTGAPT